MIQSKNLKLKLGLCGLALTSFLALNARGNTVHADTVNNANAITWDSDQDDSQVVKEEPQQVNASRNVQTQGAVQKQEAPAIQSVQSNNQKRAEKSTVRVSNFDTSTVNRLNANSVRNNQVKLATVHDTAQMPVQKTKVAQFNQGSQIYTLNGSNQLSKNNGDGYVITNAGMYNGRAVDIGVTINNVQNNQGTYTTKWSNGDHADVTGKTDASFKYQNSVLAGTQQNNVAVPNQTRNRPENKEVTANSVDHTFYVGWNPFAGTDYANIGESAYAISPKLLTDVMTYYSVDSYKAADMILKAYAKPEADIVGLKAGEVNYNSTSDPMYRAYSALTDELITNVNNLRNSSIDGEVQHTQKEWNGLVNAIDSYASYMKLSNNGNTLTDHNWGTLVASGIVSASEEPNFSGYGSANHYIYVLSEKDNKFDPQIMSGDTNKYLMLNHVDVLGSEYQDPEYGTKWHLSKEAQDIFNGTNKYTIVKPVQVTDTLQLDQVNNGSLNYNYTVGLYDAQTGDLITDLKAEYKGKTGAQATASTNVMNSAIKNKIQQINRGQATVSYTGTSANDDVAFYQETRQVNPQDKNVNRQVQRVIHINFPNGVKPKSYDSITDSAGNKLTLDSNNNLTQLMSFTRTGTQNIVSGQTTYGPWQQHGAINAVTLPAIPGYTMVTTN